MDARTDVMRRLHDNGFSTSQIGRWLQRDHSTVIYHLRARP
jgi:chromosomal replication initiation ATPase DnaA